MSRTTKQPYRHSRAFDRTCRNHGSCPWCAMGRQHKTLKRIQSAVGRSIDINLPVG